MTLRCQISSNWRENRPPGDITTRSSKSALDWTSENIHLYTDLLTPGIIYLNQSCSDSQEYSDIWIQIRQTVERSATDTEYIQNYPTGHGHEHDLSRDSSFEMTVEVPVES
jgi:hypothetical protein